MIGALIMEPVGVVLDAIQDGIGRRAALATKLLVPSVRVILQAEDGREIGSATVKKLKDVLLFRLRQLH